MRLMEMDLPQILKSTFGKVFRRIAGSVTIPRESVLHRPLQDNIDDLKALRLMSEVGDWIRLEEVGHELLLQNPPQHEPIELVAYSLQQGGRLEAAAEIAAEATEVFPCSWIFHFLAGVSLKGKGREKDACKYLRQALAICPNDRQTIRQLIEAIAKSDGIELAASEYTAHCHVIGIQADIVEARIRTVRDWAHNIGLSLQEAGEVEETPFKAPHVWGSSPAVETVFGLSNKPYIAEIKDARIFSNSSIILTCDGTALSDTGGHPNLGRFVSFAYEKIVLAQQSDKVLLNFSEYNTREIEAGIFLSGLASSAFGHWLPEFLPKLQFLQQHRDFAKLPIIVDAGMPQSHFDHLRRLVNNPLILLQENESLLCRRLLVAPSPAFFPVEMFPNNIPAHEIAGLSPKAMRFLLTGEVSENKKYGRRRIFLARKNMKWRRLLNEEEIAANLEKLGFETIFIEEMTVGEQIELFQQAQWIVAPNGSALLNLIYSDPRVNVLILSQKNLFNWGAFQGCMESLGYSPIWVCSDEEEPAEQKHSSYRISIKKIENALLSLGFDSSLCVDHKC